MEDITDGHTEDPAGLLERMLLQLARIRGVIVPTLDTEARQRLLAKLDTALQGGW